MEIELFDEERIGPERVSTIHVSHFVGGGEQDG